MQGPGVSSFRREDTTTEWEEKFARAQPPAGEREHFGQIFKERGGTAQEGGSNSTITNSSYGGKPSETESRQIGGEVYPGEGTVGVAAKKNCTQKKKRKKDRNLQQKEFQYQILLRGKVRTLRGGWGLKKKKNNSVKF